MGSVRTRFEVGGSTRNCLRFDQSNESSTEWRTEVEDWMGGTLGVSFEVVGRRVIVFGLT